MNLSSITVARAAFADAETPTGAFAGTRQRRWCGWTSVTGRLSSYSCEDAAVIMFIDAESLATAAGLATIQQGLAELRTTQWADQPDVRGIVTSAFWYDRQLNRVVRRTGLFEIGDAGGVNNVQSMWTFTLSTASGSALVASYAAFGLDCLVVVLGMLMVYHALWRFAVGVELNSRWTNAVDLSFALDALVLGMMGGYVVVRFDLWGEIGAALPPPDDVSRIEAFERLQAVGGRDQLARALAAWLLLATVFRTTYSLRYVSRVSLVFETIAASAADLVSNVILGLVVVTAYALAGQVLWFTLDTPLQSLGRGMLFLFNFMISVDAGGSFEELEVTHPVVTTVFFVTLFLISWCVLMNVLVGVLATAFAAAATTQVVVRRPVWRIESVAKDLFSLVSRLTSGADGRAHPLADPHTGAVGERLVTSAEGAAVLATAGEGHFELGIYAHRETNPLLTLITCGRSLRPSTLRALHFIDRLRDVKKHHGNDAFLTIEEAAGMSLFDPAVTVRMLTKAELHVGVSDANRRRWLIMQKLIRVEKDVSAQLSVQYRQLQELTEALCGAELGADAAAESDSDSDQDDARADAVAAGGGSDDGPTVPDEALAAAAAPFGDDSTDGSPFEASGGSDDPVSPTADADADDDREATASVAALEAQVRRRRREQRLQERRAFHGTMAEVQRLLSDVERVSLKAQQRRATIASAVDISRLEALAAEYERMALSIGVVVV